MAIHKVSGLARLVAAFRDRHDGASGGEAIILRVGDTP